MVIIYNDLNGYIQQALENNDHSKTGIKIEICITF